MNLPFALLYAAFLGVAHFGWGHWILARILPQEQGWFSTSQSIFVGLFGAIGFAFAVHFIFPLGSEFLFLFWVIGFILGLSYAWNQHKKGDLHWGPSPFVFVFLLLAFLAAAPTIELYDTGLYHLPFVRWMQSERMVFGLANLESRFGFNSSLHVWAAFIGNNFLPPNTPFIANAFLFSTFFLWLFEELWKLRFSKDDNDERPFLLGLVVFLSPLLINGIFLFFYNTGLPVDLPAGAFSVLACYSCFALARGSETRKNGVLVFVMGCLAVTAKLSQIAAFLYLLFAGYFLFRKRDGELIKKLVVICGGFGALWVFQTWMMTGCLLFPIPATCLSSRFSFAPEEMRILREEILAWAQNGTTYYRPGWLGPWLASLKKEHHLIQMAFFSLLSLLFWSVRIWRKQIKSVKEDVALLLCAGAFLITWFVGAPDLRFGYVLFVILMLTSFNMAWRGFIPRRIGSLLLILFFMAMASKLWMLPNSFSKASLFEFRNPPVELVRAGEASVWHPTGVQACWDNQRPCAMFPRKILFNKAGWFQEIDRLGQ